MNKNSLLALTMLFIVVAVALNTVIFTEDRLVVKVAMFASGIAVGIMLRSSLSIRRLS